MSDYRDHGGPPALPLAYLITFRCYGTWLHGNPRGSMDREHNVYGAPMIPASERLENSERRQLKHPPVTLDARQRRVVEAAIRGVCTHRQYVVHALNVRTNHVHCVVAVARPPGSAPCKPEPMLDAFKAYATRALRQAGSIGSNTKLWSRHGSTIYLWTEQDVGKAIEYVTVGQGDELFRRDYATPRPR